MNRTDSGAGQHGNRQFRNHGQVNGNPVALFNAQFLKDIGEFVDFIIQFLIGQCPAVADVSFPDDCRFVLAGQVLR